MIQLTNEKLTELFTARGGITYATLQLGVEFHNGGPLPWRHRITGTCVSDEKWERLLATRTVTARRNAKDQPSLFK